ncbi:hypothetical protein A2771_01900 [Candidatus Woesebacteria bacterium RIFCSPHIGHO2_01_FULL_38_26b]|uniref:Uncharacterized protein n=1 Tax=Candidatus Woesebacteria bacterium RIFCSPHIGHO2_01_FULL_38_26b TaxID=1802491 RepID=A0A1F7XVB3_9BACT|nr:MAG: hypothetical protein A2771_01900 [Candidatus Woesebacteria bacterium RIFCSPHIGHO2_01_FULL_38_26b]
MNEELSYVHTDFSDWRLSIKKNGLVHLVNLRIGRITRDENWTVRNISALKAEEQLKLDPRNPSDWYVKRIEDTLHFLLVDNISWYLKRGYPPKITVNRNEFINVANKTTGKKYK